LHPRAIHQFHTGAAYGDGITNGMFFIQKILRQSGYRSDIYCIEIDPGLLDRVLPYASYEDNYDDLLLVHYSLGSGEDDWITARRSPRVLVYHNITPAHFFPDGHWLRALAEGGRRQLAQWASSVTFAGAIADSAFNGDELLTLGFRSVANVGLLVDLERIRAHKWNSGIATEVAGARNLLFVGRVCENKNQLALVQMMRHLGRISDVPVRLLLVGSTTLDDYEADVRRAIDAVSSSAPVRMLGRRSDEDVYALYRAADVYVSFSQHEGFGMPLVEAMAFDLPVLAHSAGSVAATLGPGGLILNDTTPESLAAAVNLILHEPGLRRGIIAGQRAALARYERPVLVDAFEQYLRQLGFEVTFDKTGRPALAQSGSWAVEGPFDSSYSLAIVNRELAKALTRAGEVVTLTSRDGPGSFEPDAAFLEANPNIAAMLRPSCPGAPPDVCLRNQFPPHVADMRGAVRVLANYAWEESGFPVDWVREFNASLDLITVTSRYVAKVLRDNGVDVPIEVVGNGADQILTGQTPPGVSRDSHRPFRFLHISSGFPRKGLDVLLTAWGKAFTRLDRVELVIKTFPNIHNHVEAQFERFRRNRPDAAPITIINKDLSQDTLRGLYMDADALVFPSRGEGFGLPLAEALFLGKPVITTAYGGASDFCTIETAWLCDYRFAYAATHLGVFDSVWAEPDPESLRQVLWEVFAATAAERARKAEAGQARMLADYTWDRVAQRTRVAVARIRRKLTAKDLRSPVIGLISTWNSRCGIADYARSLVHGIEPERLRVFATKVSELVEPDEEFVRRCWVEGWDDPLDELFQQVRTADIDAAVIQFNFGFFRLVALRRLIERLIEYGIPVFITLHSTMDVIRPDITIRLDEIQRSLARACRLLVHSVHDLNRLRASGLIDNVTLFPMGSPAPFSGDRAAKRRSLGLAGKTVIASFGYLLPNKGLQELIGAMARLRARVPNAHLLLLNALYPDAASQEELHACQERIDASRLVGHVTLVTDFLDADEVIARLAAADIIVYPYQQTQESASAAVKMGLSSLTPVAVTPLPIFADIAAVAYTLPGMAAADIAEGLGAFFAQSDHTVLRERQKAWIEAHAWSNLSARLDGLIRGELRAKFDGSPDKDPLHDRIADLPTSHMT
jgi:glycosyltransferase involved in cell wall biosynthesis